MFAILLQEVLNFGTSHVVIINLPTNRLLREKKRKHIGSPSYLIFDC
uniref:Uncharacterized protein n=1 Tax=Anguilla anguilla TaxID=7936 RepID=A0A0E9TR70_ANGAN